jgi:hypothetical protein
MHHVMHSIVLSKASFVTCSTYESEKTSVDQVSEKVHPPMVLVNLEILGGTNLLYNVASLGA